MLLALQLQKNTKKKLLCKFFNLSIVPMPLNNITAISRQQYLDVFKHFSFDEWSLHCNDNNLIPAISYLYRGDYESFLNDFDFQAFELPLSLEQFTDNDWEEIRGWISECYSELAEARALKRNPASVDPGY